MNRNTHIQFRIASKLKTAFFEKCENESINASALIRKLIQRWVEADSAT